MGNNPSTTRRPIDRLDDQTLPGDIASNKSAVKLPPPVAVKPTKSREKAKIVPTEADVLKTLSFASRFACLVDSIDPQLVAAFANHQAFKEMVTNQSHRDGPSDSRDHGQNDVSEMSFSEPPT